MKISKLVMRKTTIALLCSCAFMAQAAQSESEIKDESYALGASVGKYISSKIYDQTELGVDVQVQTVIDGVIDALKNETKMSDEQILTHLNARAELLNNIREQQLAEQSAQSLAAGQAYLADNKSQSGATETASGLQYEVIKQGDGRIPLASDVVTVHYKGELIDGTVFDNSRDRDEPNRFALMTVIEGWQEGIQLMPEGSIYRLSIPTELAYGERQVGVIPPNSTLVFDVELMKVESPGENSHGMGLSGMGMGGMMGTGH
ncbi:FKBP-type peptidyl-prolyl cis-trans isomerase [Shewanella waksmanii]|uniref:FKBP-type peptidyl-prolyl cis-trans isomerase n=1 Tax=Shewanella waksmanii TaxID=213783 RepID=UPI00048FE770|nr:FKBP-type peptidyl-prolyl cis-trans isomerase [Shewanella waksmanii]